MPERTVKHQGSNDTVLSSDKFSWQCNALVVLGLSFCAMEQHLLDWCWLSSRPSIVVAWAAVQTPDSGEDWPVACLVPYLDVICLVWSGATNCNLLLDCLNSLVVQ